MLNTSLSNAQNLDKEDALKKYKESFFIPKNKDGNDVIYMCGNSLGLMPKKTQEYVSDIFDDWKNLAVEGHFNGKNPWISYHHRLVSPMATIVGALPSEIVLMNTLTVNLHLLMVSFYRPDEKRNKILFDFNPFPSDRYAIESQIRFHGYHPKEAMIELQPNEGNFLISTDTILKTIEDHGDEIALILIGGINYYTGQLYDIKEITRLGHQYGCRVGFDLAHAAGNAILNLHDDGPDFAAWCTYKYLNAGPGNLSGIFIHERHHENSNLNRFTGWYGNTLKTRFLMKPEFEPLPTAEGWQVSNQPMLGLAAMRASLEIFEEVGMKALRAKSEKLTTYLEYLVNQVSDNKIKIITPEDNTQRGCQLSLQMKNPNKALFNYLMEHGVILDWREPDVLRVAPTPLYNTYEDVWHFHRILKDGLNYILP